MGRYPIRMLVKGDHSQAAMVLHVVKAGTGTVVFDIDGTLLDSAEDICGAVRQVLARGQVTLGQEVLKASAKKLRRLYNDRILAGFAGSTADAFALFGRFESKLEQHSGNLARGVVERKGNFSFLVVSYQPNRKLSGRRKAVPQHLVSPMLQGHKIMYGRELSPIPRHRPNFRLTNAAWRGQ